MLLVEGLLLATHVQDGLLLLLLLQLYAANFDHKLVRHLLNLVVEVHIEPHVLWLLLLVADVLRCDSEDAHSLRVR